MTFTDFLNTHVSKEMVSFHMPGHKGRGIFDIHGMKDALDSLVNGDITEIPGSDNLSQPQGIIRDIMDRYKAIYGSEESFISVSGSTLGLITSILAACAYEGAAAGPGAANTVAAAAAASSRRAAIAIARNSHKSVFNGVVLSGARPVFIYPELPASGLAGEITPEAAEDAFKRAEAEGLSIKALVIPSPNYYGICSRIGEIAKIAHKNNALLIVDQAHGAHLRFTAPDLTADIENRADIVVESTHKTLASFTQTAIINIYNQALVDVFEEKLKMLQTTSPSYMLMKSLDMNADLIEKYGSDLFESWNINLDTTYKALDELGISYFQDTLHDRSKILIDMSAYGFMGSDLSKALFERGIVTELDSGAFSMCMTGIGNSKGDYERLITALKDIKDGATKAESSKEAAWDAGALYELMNKSREIRDIPGSWEWVKAEDADGRVAAESIVPYPPGIPLVCAGEVIDSESVLWAETYRKHGERVFGMTEEGLVKVGIL